VLNTVLDFGNYTIYTFFWILLLQLDFGYCLFTTWFCTIYYYYIKRCT